MKQFPVLYKRAKSGKIQEWSIKTEGNDNLFLIFIEQGQIDGKKQIYRESVMEGKQKRTIEEQAISEAQSKFNKKRDEGYKSLEDLNILHLNDCYYYYNIEQPLFLKTEERTTDNRFLTLEEVLDIYLPKESTDASGNVKPMLAQSYKKGKTKFPIYGQPKLNGVRCLAILTEQGQVTLLSRSGKQYIVDHIIEAFGILPAQDIILDGELYCHGMELNRIVAAVKKPNEDTPRLEYHVYDIVDSTSIQKYRTSNLITLIGSEEIIVNLGTLTIRNDEEVKNYHDMYIAQGYEGLILRDIEGKYEIGVRSKNLLKVKEFKDEEFVILGAELGTRGTEDMVFVLKCRDGEDSINTNTFKAKPIGNRKQKEEYWNNIQSLVGKEGTVRYFNTTEYGIPFHAIFICVRDY